MSLTDTTQPGASLPSTAPLAAQVQKWSERLIDTSKRNRLLYFKPDHNNASPIVSREPAQLWESLTSSTKALEFFLPPQEISKGRFGPGGTEATAETQKREALLLEDVARLAKLGPSQLVIGGRTVKTSRAFLLNLYRKYRENLEERGLNVAYVAFGLLHWKDPNAAEEEGSSPIALIPVVVDRKTPASPVTISAGEDEIIYNPALLFKLQGLGVDTSALELEGAPETLEGALLFFEQIASTHRFLRFQTGAWVGYFSFHKLVMYQDLQRNRPSKASETL